MWWLRKTWLSFATQKVFFELATAGKDVPSEALGDPQRGRSVASGAPDRDTDSRPATRTTLSSVRMWMGRSWTRK